MDKFGHAWFEKKKTQDLAGQVSKFTENLSEGATKKGKLIKTVHARFRKAKQLSVLLWKLNMEVIALVLIVFFWLRVGNIVVLVFFIRLKP